MLRHTGFVLRFFPTAALWKEAGTMLDARNYTVGGVSSDGFDMCHSG